MVGSGVSICTWGSGSLRIGDGWEMLGGLGSWPRMVSGCGSFLKLLKQEILLWMTHKDPLSGGGWGRQEKKIFLFPSLGPG